MGPKYGPFGRLRRILGTLKGTYRVYARYIKVPALEGKDSLSPMNLQGERLPQVS